MKRYLTLVLALFAVGSLFTSPEILSDEGEWSRKADMPTGRAWFSASAVNGKIYAIGGWYNGMTLSVVEEYDPITDTWTRKADMPTQRDGLSTIAVNGKIYAIGGLFEETALLLPTVEEYDPATDTWTKKADLSSARAEFSLSSLNGKIYIFGGGSFEALDTVEEYDPVKDIWTEKADMPTPRCKLARYAPVVNGKIYVMGGSEVYYPESGVFSTAEEYDPATDTWAKKADMPTARWGLALGEVDGKIYAIGGERSYRTNFLKTVEEYDPAIDTWTTKADMPTGRCAFASAVVNGMIYAMGGLNQNGILSIVEAYDTGVREGTGPSLPWVHVIQPRP